MITKPIQAFINEVGHIETQHSAPSDTPKIHAEELTNRAGKLYEKIRYLVDYQDESSVRRNAMTRVLKRMLKLDPFGFDARRYLEDLVRGGYLPNDAISEATASHVEAIVKQYAHDTAMVPIAACEIEALLFPDPLGVAAVEAMYQTVFPLVEFQPALPESEAQTQVYIACVRTLLKYDDTAVSWLLWRWRGEISRAQLKHPIGPRLARMLKDQALFFEVLRRIAVTHGVDTPQMLEDHASLEQAVRSILKDQYEHQTVAMRSASWRAIGYVLLTKVLVALAVEVPVDHWITGQIYYAALATNILFPPVLLYTTTRGLDVDEKSNTKAIASGIAALAQGGGATIVVKTMEGRGFFHTLFYIVYALLGIGIFGLVAWGLHLVHFNIASIALFMLFLALVSYFGYRIRHGARQWTVTTPAQGLGAVLRDLAFVPVVRAGQWLSQRFSSVNVFVLFLDYVIETPFKMLLRFSDAFLAFLKEKREQIS